MSFVKIKSCIKKYDFVNFEKLLDDIKKYKYAIIYKSDCVKTLHTKDVDSNVLTDFLEVRAFDGNGELKVIYDGEYYIGRVRADGNGDDFEVVDENHLLWGNHITKEENGYTSLSEDRGTRLELPLEVNDKKRAFITVRNYLNPDENIFEFNDYRMVEFFAKGAKEYGNK